MGYFRDKSRWHTWIFVWSISNILVQIYHTKTSHILVTSTNIVHWHILIMERAREMLTGISRWSRFLWTILCHSMWTELVLIWDCDGLLWLFQVKQTVSDLTPNTCVEQKTFSRSYLHVYMPGCVLICSGKDTTSGTPVAIGGTKWLI